MTLVQRAESQVSMIEAFLNAPMPGPNEPKAKEK
jgi:hypothetical protein